MLQYNGEKYYSPQEAVDKFRLAQSTIYYWADNNIIETLDLDEFCKGLPLEPKELRSQIYIAESVLREKVREMKK